ncbi:MAG: aminotransferase class III-fold pyridoxal phosphate-dependent enzyme [Lysobacter sp.]|nr:MAG: aminotransferase class III-fold pyridoxal phosphate-dependent enzyme [Lysobacter sp.]
MATSVEDVLESILTKKFDRQEALRHFAELDDEQKLEVVAGLRSRLPAGNDVGGDGASAKPTLKSLHELNMGESHIAYIADLTEKYEKRVPKSKDNALKHQAYFVDQRKTAGLKRPLKSLQFQLTYDRADGPYIWDVDGNRYIDVAGDNGVNLFGHQPEFMKKALIDRMNRGYPLVAYSEDLFQAAKMFCELTGHERMVFAQSGTESLMWAVRIARAATGRKKIVTFDGSYHGLSDAVLAFRDRKGGSISAGLGMLQEFADQLIILDYGNMDQIETIEKRADEIACVLVEPIQSRFPSRQPKEFVRELRRLTLEKDIVLIFDEMITGFRAGPKGVQTFYGVKPDIATYGKVAGGGMPTGVIGGLAKYMDYVDGGTWRFDDASMPSLKRTMMAGTHTQNSLKVAAALAICEEMKRMCGDRVCDYHSCTCALGDINRKTEALSLEINAYFEQHRIPMVVEYFSSLFRIQVIDDPFGLTREVFFILLKINGVETSTSGNCFLTTTHSDDDCKAIVDAVKNTIDTMLAQGFFVEPEVEPEPEAAVAASPSAPVKEAPAAPTAAKAAAPVADTAAAIERLKALIMADLGNVKGGGA